MKTLKLATAALLLASLLPVSAGAPNDMAMMTILHDLFWTAVSVAYVVGVAALFSLPIWLFAIAAGFLFRKQSINTPQTPEKDNEISLRDQAALPLVISNPPAGLSPPWR